MKRLVIFLVIFVFSASMLSFTAFSSSSDILPIANPSETEEILSSEEFIALILSSDVTYHLVGKSASMSSEQTFSGKIKPILDSFDSDEYTNEAGYLPFRFPIPELMQSDPVVPSQISLVFHFPFTVKQLNTLSCLVAPFTLFTNAQQSSPDYSRKYSLIYQIDNDTSVVDSYSLDVTSSSNYPFKLKSGLISYVASGVGSSPANIRFYFSYSDGDVGPRTYDTMLRSDWQSFFNMKLLSGRGTDIDTWGFTYTPTNSDGGFFPADFSGIGFCFTPMVITYTSGGGYQPDVSGGGEDESPDYSAQLDKLYDELVKQGEIQEKNFNELEGTLTNPTPSQSESVQSQQSVISEQEEIFSDYESMAGQVTLSPEQSDVLGSLNGNIQSVGDDIKNSFDNPVGTPFALFGLMFESGDFKVGGLSWQTWGILLVFAFSLISILLYGRSDS